MKSHNPTDIHPPFGDYSSGVEVKSGRMMLTSGQLGIDKDGHIPETVTEQAEICFQNIDAILKSSGFGPDDIVRINAFVTDRSYFPDYMAVRDRYLKDVAVKPASTLVIAVGFTRPEFKVEVEVTAMAEE